MLNVRTNRFVQTFSMTFLDFVLSFSKTFLDCILTFSMTFLDCVLTFSMTFLDFWNKAYLVCTLSMTWVAYNRLCLIKISIRTNGLEGISDLK